MAHPASDLETCLICPTNQTMNIVHTMPG